MRCRRSASLGRSSGLRGRATEVVAVPVRRVDLFRPPQPKSNRLRSAAIPVYERMQLDLLFPNRLGSLTGTQEIRLSATRES